MSDSDRKFDHAETERNLRAAYALRDKRRAAVETAHERTMDIDLWLSQGGVETPEAYNKAMENLENLFDALHIATKELEVIEQAIERVVRTERELAERLEREREQVEASKRPKKYAKITYDPNWKVHGPNEVLESRKWWD